MDTKTVITKFNDAFNAHDVAAIMSLMTDDCVFENTYPTPDGTRYEGQPAVKKFWQDFFTDSPSAHFDVEEMIVCADRGVVRWRYTWTGKEGKEGHVRGVDVFRVENGKVSEKLSYVKG